MWKKSSLFFPESLLVIYRIFYQVENSHSFWMDHSSVSINAPAPITIPSENNKYVNKNIEWKLALKSQYL